MLILLLSMRPLCWKSCLFAYLVANFHFSFSSAALLLLLLDAVDYLVGFPYQPASFDASALESAPYLVAAMVEA